jgi:hypothetical protein
MVFNQKVSSDVTSEDTFLIKKLILTRGGGVGLAFWILEDVIAKWKRTR